MSQRPPVSSSSDRFAVPLLWGVSFFVFLFMLFVSWQRWADVIIDFGRELYVPWQISEGKVLYRDIYYQYGPLAAYWNALLLFFFGAQAKTIIIFNFLLLGCLAGLLYRLVVSMACRLTAAFAIFAFTAFFALPHYSFIGNYNYLAPYSHALVYGLVIAMAALLIFERQLHGSSVKGAFVLGLFSGLALLTKIEPAVALWGALGVVFITRIICFSKDPGVGRKLVVLVLGVAMPLALFIILFSIPLGFSGALEALGYQYKISLNPGMVGNPFIRGMSGLDDIATSLKRVVTVSFVCAGGIALALLASWAVSLVKSEWFQRLSRILFVSLFLLAGVVYFKRVDWNIAFAPLPIFCLLFIGTSFWFVGMGKQGMNQVLLRVGFGIFALILIGKIILKSHIFHYGFVLALPAFLAMLIFLLHDIPAILPSRRFDARTFQVIMGGILIFLACIHIGFSFKLYKLKTYPLGSESGRFLTYDEKISNVGPVLAKTIEYLRGTARKGESLIVMPEGVMLNFLLKMPNPTPYYDLVPTTIALVGEGVVLEAFKRASPDYVIILERDMSEYGTRYFGRDYALAIFEWVKANYRPVFQAGVPPSSGQGFGVVVLRKSRQMGI